MRNARALIPACCLLATLACSKTVRTSSLPAVQMPRGSAVQTMVKRQIANARDAGEGDGLLAELRRRVITSPDNLPARMELAAAYQQRGFTEVAIEHYRTAAERHPDEAGVRVALARALRSLGLTTQALFELETAAQTLRQAQLLTWLGILRDEAGKLDQAAEAYRAALLLDPKSDLLHNNLGYNLLARGKAEEAEAEFREALKLAPGSDIARNNLGIALASKPHEAMKQWQDGLDAASAHNNLAAILIENGKIEEARNELEAALRYRPDLPQALSNLALISELEGQPAEWKWVPGTSRWRRLGRGLKKVLTGIEEKDSREESIRTAQK